MIALLALLLAGSAVYCCLVIFAAERRWPAAPQASAANPPLSILKPLAGADDGLEANLRSFFEQRYGGDFEILFAVRDAADPAASVAKQLIAEHATTVPARLIIVGEPAYPNAKVWSLEQMTEAARYELLVMSDSDIRVTPSFLATVAAGFSERPGLHVLTCPYRAIGGPGLWSRLEALMMNTDFIAGVLVARMLEGMKFAVGPTIAARKAAIRQLGGWVRFKDYLAEDFVLGQRAAEAGLGVDLSSYVIEHRIGNQPVAANSRHRLRWCRSTRRSRPAGYVGQLFTFPLPLAAILLWFTGPEYWPFAMAAVWLRLWAAFATTRRLGDRLSLLLLPPADVASFGFWIAGFFGNTIAWRGRDYYLHRDGRFERVTP
jgi:ceramide glucosyltransferase